MNNLELKEIRKKLKFSQADMAKELGLSVRGYQNWEQGDRKEDGRRAYFTKKYNSVKTYLEITSEYNIYSFRHTYITRLYQYLRKEMTKTQAIDYLSLCTGHTGNAIKNYIHVLDAELPKDYSKGLRYLILVWLRRNIGFVVRANI